MSKVLEFATVTLPDVGKLTLVKSAKGYCRLLFGNEPVRADRYLHTHFPGHVLQKADAAGEAAARELLEAFFRGEETALAFDLHGTPFQQNVWKAIARIPHGKVISYGAIARKLGKPRASRAVGQATGKNPLPVLVPCHRVVGSHGELGGFSCGLPLKKKLLGQEGHRL